MMHDEVQRVTHKIATAVRPATWAIAFLLECCLQRLLDIQEVPLIMPISRSSNRSQAGIPVILAAVVACMAILAVPSAAHADRYIVYGPGPAPPPPGYGYAYYYYEPPYALVIGGDIEGVIPLSVPRFFDGHDLTSGGGFKLRIGEQIRLRGGLRITPELGYGYDRLFATNDVDDSWDMHRVFGGVRLSFGRFVVPVIYGHVGYGWRVTGDPEVSDEGGAAFDFGGALDFRVTPHFSFGAHIEYATIAEESYAPQWVALGAHCDIVF